MASDALTFDDLVPEQPQKPLDFGDLVPAAPQMDGAMRYPAMAGSAVAKGALTGVGVLGDLKGLLQRSVAPAADVLARALGFPPRNQPTRQPTMGSGNLTQA